MTTIITQDILRRAELFNEIVGLVHAATLAKDAEGMEISVVDPGAHRKLYPPTFVIVQNRLICNGTTIDLSRRPIVLHLLRLFLEANMRPLTREELVVGLYGHYDEAYCSQRYRESLLSNAVKVVSRARIVLTTHLTGIGTDVDWLVYDPVLRVWHLYKLRGI